MADDNIIPFPELEDWSRDELDARELAHLSALSAIDYERGRRAAGKKLGIRLSTLNRMVAQIRRAAERKAYYGPPEKPMPVGKAIRFYHDDGRRVWGFLVAAYRSSAADRDSHLLVLADGQETAVWSVPLDDDDPRVAARRD